MLCSGPLIISTHSVLCVIPTSCFIPLPPPLSHLLAASVSLFLFHKEAHLYHFLRSRTWEIPYGLCPSPPNSLHSVWPALGPSVLLHVALALPFAGLQSSPLYVLAQCSKQPLGRFWCSRESELHPCPHLLFDPSFSLDRQRQGLYTFTIRHCVQQTLIYLALSTSGPCCPASATSFIHIQVPSRPGCLGLLLCRGWAPLDGMVSRTCSLWERRGVCVPLPLSPALREVIPGPYPSLVRAFFCFSPLHSAAIPSSPRVLAARSRLLRCRLLMITLDRLSQHAAVRRQFTKLREEGGNGERGRAGGGGRESKTGTQRRTLELTQGVLSFDRLEPQASVW